MRKVTFIDNRVKQLTMEAHENGISIIISNRGKIAIFNLDPEDADTFCLEFKEAVRKQEKIAAQPKEGGQ